MTLFLVDFHPVHQAGLSLAALKAAGIVGVMCKISEGHTLYRSGYHAFAREAKRLDLLLAAYHWPRRESDPKIEAEFVRDCMEDDHGRVPIMVDWEEADTVKTVPSVAHVNTFVSEYRRIGGICTLNYIPEWIWSKHLGFTSLALGPIGSLALVASNYGANRVGSISALYPGDHSSRWDSYGAKAPVILQFGSQCRIPGYAGNLDINAFRGTLTELRAVFGGINNRTEDNMSWADKFSVPAVPNEDGRDTVPESVPVPASEILRNALAAIRTIQSKDRARDKKLTAIADDVAAIKALPPGSTPIDYDALAAAISPYIQQLGDSVSDDVLNKLRGRLEG